MITFDQTLDAVERVHDLLKSTDELEHQVKATRSNLADFENMLQYAHQKEFSNADQALEYIDKVLIPRLQGMIQALDSSVEEPLKRLQTAKQHTQRLVVNLQMVTGGNVDGLPG